MTGSLSLGGLSVNPAVVTQALPGGASIYPIVEKVLLLFVPYIIANFVIFVVVAGLVGKYANRIIDPSSGKKGRKKGAGTVIVVIAIAVLIAASIAPLFHIEENQNAKYGNLPVSSHNMQLLVSGSSPLFMAPLPSHYISGIALNCLDPPQG